MLVFAIVGVVLAGVIAAAMPYRGYVSLLKNFSLVMLVIAAFVMIGSFLGLALRGAMFGPFRLK